MGLYDYLLDMKYHALCILLIGCANNAPNHVGNPLSWPAQAVATGIQNASYNQRRNKVKRYVSQNFAEIHRDVQAGGGSYLSHVVALAGVPAHKQMQLLKELQSNTNLYFSSNAEPLVVALMVHGP
jgi:hypothetical protein